MKASESHFPGCRAITAITDSGPALRFIRDTGMTEGLAHPDEARATGYHTAAPDGESSKEHPAPISNSERIGLSAGSGG